MSAKKSKIKKFNRRIFYRENPHLRPKRAQVVIIDLAEEEESLRREEKKG